MSKDDKSTATPRECPNCWGRGHYYYKLDDGVQCRVCDATGRVVPYVESESAFRECYGCSSPSHCASQQRCSAQSAVEENFGDWLRRKYPACRDCYLHQDMLAAWEAGAASVRGGQRRWMSWKPNRRNRCRD